MPFLRVAAGLGHCGGLQGEAPATYGAKRLRKFCITSVDYSSVSVARTTTEDLLFELIHWSSLSHSVRFYVSR